MPYREKEIDWVFNDIYRRIISDKSDGVIDSRVDEVCKIIRSQYAQPHRAYHTIAHINKLQLSLSFYGTKTYHGIELKGFSYESLQLAVLFHDIVYDTNSTTNEEDSANMAQNLLEFLGYPYTDYISEVRRLVLLTKSLNPDPEDLTGKLLLRSDLGVLFGGSYLTYEYAIWKEYCQHDYEVFRDGRIKALNNILPFVKPIFSLTNEEAIKSPYHKQDEVQDLNNLTANLQSSIALTTAELTRDNGKHCENIMKMWRKILYEKPNSI